MSGGGLRACYLLRELARRFRTTAFVRDDPDRLREWITAELGEASDLRIIQIPTYQRPTGLLHRLAHRLETLIKTGDPLKPTDAVQFELHRLTESYLKDHHTDIVLATNLESWPLLRQVRRKFPAVLTVLDLHNIESSLRLRDLNAQGLSGEADKRTLQLRKEESRLSRSVDLALVCSDDDGRQLSVRTKTPPAISVLPNGVAVEKTPFDSSPDKWRITQILFCGTLKYSPNIQGLNWFLESVWPLVTARDSAARLQIVGRGYEAQNFPSLSRLSTVEIVGEVPAVAPYYRNSSIAVCPLLSGSGTRLKILEAMSFGNPIVSTHIGCEGLAVRDARDMLIRDDPKAFAEAILALRVDVALFERLRRQAAQTVCQKYDWQSIGSVLENALKSKLAEHLAAIGSTKYRT